MTESIESVGQLLRVSPTGLGREHLAAIEGSPAMAAVRASLAVVSAVMQSEAAASVAAALKEALDTPISDVLAGAWNTRRQLLEYLDRTKYPPKEVFGSPLGEHTIESTHHPRVMVLLDGANIGEVEFTLTLTLTLEAAVLRIRDAHIIGASTGNIQGKARLSLGQAVLAEPGTRKFTLPGSLSFGEGIPIKGMALTS